MIECGNRLPCGWCDIKNEQCSIMVSEKRDATVNYEENNGHIYVTKIYDDDKNCNHKWRWWRSTSKGHVYDTCDNCMAIKVKYQLN